jgi:hypothetical protein
LVHGQHEVVNPGRTGTKSGAPTIQQFVRAETTV